MVKFKMDSEFVEEVENYVSYKLQSCKEYSLNDLVLTPCLVIADLGGLLGLFLGCSLISIVEMFYYAVTGLLSSLFRIILSRKIERTSRSVLTVASVRERELQVSNNEILQALNTLTRSVHNINMKVDNNHREVMKKHSVFDRRVQVLEQKEVLLKVIDLD